MRRVYTRAGPCLNQTGSRRLLEAGYFVNCFAGNQFQVPEERAARQLTVLPIDSPMPANLANIQAKMEPRPMLWEAPGG